MKIDGHRQMLKTLKDHSRKKQKKEIKWKKRRLRKEHFKWNTAQESMDISECIRADLLVFLSTVFKSIKRWLWREIVRKRNEKKKCDFLNLRIFILRRCVSLPRQGRAMINVLQSGEHFYQFFPFFVLRHPYRPLKFVIFHREFLRFWFFNISKYTRFADRHSGKRRKKRKKMKEFHAPSKSTFLFFFNLGHANQRFSSNSYRFDIYVSFKRVCIFHSSICSPSTIYHFRSYLIYRTELR